MTKFRKKPVVIEAMLFYGTEESAVRICAALSPHVPPEAQAPIYWDGHALVIQTLEGALRSYGGDWIIKGIKGELYPCKPDIFDATYERVEEP